MPEIFLPPTAHVRCALSTYRTSQPGHPDIFRLFEVDDRYAITFDDISFHVTEDQWDAIDTAVRAGITAAKTERASA